jgi:methionyl-tRNA synthetase
MEKISFGDFSKLDLRIAKIIEVEEVPEKDKLYKLTVEIGEEKRTLVAGLKEFYSKEELMNKLIVVLANLEPKNIAGIESQGMLLAAEEKGSIALLTTDKEIEPGTRVH